MSAAFSGAAISARVVHGETADVIASGRYSIAALGRDGSHNGAEAYDISLASSGVFTEAPPEPPTPVDEYGAELWEFSGYFIGGDFIARSYARVITPWAIA